MVNDEGIDSDHTGASESTNNFPDVVAEAVTALSTGVPPQVQRSFFKAFSRVFAAGAEWPAKYLEGRSNIAAARARAEVAKIDAERDEVKALQKAREVIYQGSSKAAAGFFKNPDQAHRALQYHASDILREQSVREDVLLIAASDIKSSPPPTDAAEEIDDDWLHSFFKESTKRSKEEYKQIFGRILAGEIKQPGSFSIGTIQALARINQNTADIFQRACFISTRIGPTLKIIHQISKPAGDNGLMKFGLNYDNLALLVEEGLLRPEFNEHINIPTPLINNGFTIEHAGISMLMHKVSTAGENTDQNYAVHGPSFTTSGAELRKVVNITPNSEYIIFLSDLFGTSNIDLYRDVYTQDGKVFGDRVPMTKP